MKVPHRLVKSPAFTDISEEYEAHEHTREKVESVNWDERVVDYDFRVIFTHLEEIYLK